jgi:acyl-CoA reductase-like NAD-dependent aldehyde dehydrogenase
VLVSQVLEDANVQKAAEAIVYGALVHSGQVCMSTERVIVQKGISQKLLSTVVDLCKDIKAGDTENDPDAKLSALCTDSSAQNVVSLITEAVHDGAELLLGDCSTEGSVVQPHIVNGVRRGMRLWSQETFGPG